MGRKINEEIPLTDMNKMSISQIIDYLDIPQYYGFEASAPSMKVSVPQDNGKYVLKLKRNNKKVFYVDKDMFVNDIAKAKIFTSYKEIKELKDAIPYSKIVSLY